MMLTVPACAVCNCTKSKHDDFFRDILVTDVQGAESPIAHRVFQEGTIRSHEKGKSLLARIALREATETPLVDNHGAVRDVLPQFRVDPNRIRETFEFMIRGLRYSIDGHRFICDTEFTTSRLLFDEHILGAINFLKGIRLSGPLKIGEGVFECHYAIAQDEPNSSIWLLRFYDRVLYRVITRAKQKP